MAPVQSPPLSPGLMAAELMLNANAARQAPRDVPLSGTCSAVLRLSRELEDFCDRYHPDGKYLRRDYLRDVIGAQPAQQKGKYCCLPDWAGEILRKDGSWAARQSVNLGQFQQFLGDVSGLSPSTVGNRLYDSGARQNYSTVEKLYTRLAARKADLEAAPFYHRFGRHPVGTDSAKTMAARRGALVDRLKECWPDLPEDLYMDFLALTAETGSNLKKNFFLDVSTAYRFLIVLCSGDDSALQEAVYHTFYLHALPDHAGDCVAKICMDHYDGIIGSICSRKYGYDQAEAALPMFWQILKGQLRYLDSRSPRNPDMPGLLGLFFPRIDSVEEISMDDQRNEAY